MPNDKSGLEERLTRELPKGSQCPGGVVTALQATSPNDFSDGVPDHVVDCYAAGVFTKDDIKPEVMAMIEAAYLRRVTEVAFEAAKRLLGDRSDLAKRVLNASGHIAGLLAEPLPQRADIDKIRSVCDEFSATLAAFAYDQTP